MAYVKKFSSHGFFESNDIPFKVKFNFSKMFEYWESLTESDIEEVASYAKKTLKRLNKVKILRTGFSDEKIVEKHAKELKLLLSPIFPEMITNNEIKAACMPFMPVVFNFSQRFENIYQAAGEEKDFSMRVVDHNMMYINACLFILNFKYGANINYNESLYIDLVDQKTGLMKHYRVLINGDFSSFKANKEFKPLTPDEIQHLKDNFDNIDLWKEKIPPQSFEFEGFAIMHLVDVTKEEAVSALKYDLLKKDALHSPEIIDRIRLQLSSMLNKPDLKLGFTAFDKDRNKLKSLAFSSWNSIILSGRESCNANEAFCSYSYPHIFKEKHSLAASHYQLDEDMIGNPLVDKLLEAGIKSYIAIPLMIDDEIIGLLELGSEKSKDLDSVVAKKLEEIAPLFATALERSIEELETQLEAIIQEKCTAIHPSVTWRFMEAAEKLLHQRRIDGTNEMEEISFPEVYPLYGQADIKGSSTARNKSIQEDMIQQLTMAKRILDLASKNNPLPIYQDFNFRIKRNIRKLKKGLGAGDEISILDFIKREIYPVFRHLNKQNGDLKKSVQNYMDSLDEDLGVIYDKRKDYEESVTMINNKIAEYVDKSQDEAQNMFPHYFEKYKTDGVEHNIYIGQSMVSNREFDPIFLANLRLWQLMMTCEIENMHSRLKKQLKVPLDICSLILIHNNPITIRFQQEDKHFDVDGAYNVRYEIIKKRIDKAYVNGTTERLTQPGKIAIVYSQESEAREYVKYLEYLQSINYISPNIEWLDLQDLQGVSGMKALRVEVVIHQDGKLKTESRLALATTNGKL